MSSSFLNNLLTSVSFGEPSWFWALLLLPALLALFFWNEKRRGELLRKLVAVRLQSALAASVSARKRRLRFFTLLAGFACVIVALAQPRWGYVFEISKRKGRDVIIAIDTSKSMLSNDLAPNRLTRAKLAAQDLINALPGDRVGVVAFAGNAFLQAPLTIDYSAALASINELDTKIIPLGGTDIAAAIRTAADAFGKGESTNHALILFTDGEELEESAVKAARDVADKMRIFTVGVGTAGGSVIPITNEQGGTDFVKDEHGQIVKSRLDENRLKEVAQATGGFYVRLQNGPEAMKQIVSQGLAPMREKEIDARQSRRPIERYQWPLALGILLLGGSILIGERRRVNAGARARKATLSRASAPAARASNLPSTTAKTAATALFLLGFLIAPSIGRCATNHGVELYDEQNYKDALDTFQQQLERNSQSQALHFDAGDAAYKNGDYEKALDAFSKAVTANDPQTREKAEYNLANTLVQRGAKQNAKDQKIREWKNAIQHYDEALKTDPKDDNAKYNRELVRKMIEDLEKEQQQQQNQQNQQQNEQQKNQQQQQNSKNDQQKQNQQNQQNQQQQQQQNQQNSQNQNSQNQQQQNSSEQQNQQSQQQQGQGEQQQQKNEQNGQQQNQQKENEQKQAQQNQQNQQQNQSDKSNDENNQQAKNSGQQNQQQQPQNQQQQNQQGQPQNAQAAPQPSQADKKLSGEIKEGEQQQQPTPRPSPGEQNNNPGAALAAEPAKPGEMNEAQARALIDSLKGEDEHVSLFNSQKENNVAQPLKDW